MDGMDEAKAHFGLAYFVIKILLIEFWQKNKTILL